MKHACETEGSSSLSRTSSEAAGIKSRGSFKSGVIHPDVGDAYPCGRKDKCSCSDLSCAVNDSTVQPPGTIPNSTTLVPGQANGETERKKSERESEPVPQPEGILKSGISCICEVCEGHWPRLQDDCEAFATPRYDPSPATPTYDPNLRFTELIDTRSKESTRDLTQGRPSSVPPAYPIAAQDRRSSSSNQSEINDVEYRLSLIRDNLTDQTESTEDQIFQRSKQELRVAFQTKIDGNSVGPPPPCSQCNNEHHLGYCMTSKRFSLEELTSVTDFSLDSKFNCSKHDDDNLYRGKLDGRPVFVAWKETAQEPSHFFPEVDVLKHLRHPNIVVLRGYCDEENSRALVFNFVCNRTLFYHLSSGNPNTMQWPDRAKLAIKLATALVYLHDRRIFHGNVNSKNIFVTHDFQPVIGEFSFSRNLAGFRDVILQNRSEDKKARGYLPPEYKQEYEAGRKVSKKLDIYAFGVILFELVSGRPSFDWKNKTNHYLGEWGRETVKEFEQNCPHELVDTMADPRLKSSEYKKDDMLRMIKVAALCTSKNPKGRPLIPMVLEMLMGEKYTKSEHEQAPPSSPPLSPLAPSLAVPRRQDWPDQDTPVIETGSAVPWTYKDQNPTQILELLRQVQIAKCKALDNNFERPPQAQKACCGSSTMLSRNGTPPSNSNAKSAIPNTKPATKTRPTKTPWFVPGPSRYNRQKRPPTPGYELLKKNRSPDTRHPRSVSSTSAQYGRSPKHSSSKKVSHSSTGRRITMSPRRHKVRVSWYIRKSGGAHLKNPSERKEHRVTWQLRRWRPSFFNFNFNKPD